MENLKRTQWGMAVGAFWLVAQLHAFALNGDLEGLNKNSSTNWGPNSAWSGGNLQGWKELDYVVVRAVLGGSPRSNQPVTLTFPKFKTDVPGFQNLYFISNSPNLFFHSAPVLSAPPTPADWSYSVNVTITNTQPGYIYYYARLAAGSHLNVGSSLQLSGEPSLSPLQIHKPDAGPGSPDLAITKVGPATTGPGDIINYTITYTNKATGVANTADGVQICDQLPSLVSFVSASGGGTNEAGFLTWDLPDLTNRANGVLTYQVRVATNAMNGQSFTNNAMILSSEDDANMIDNRASVKTTVVANRPPVANPDVYTINEDAVLNISAPGILANDTDPDVGTVLTAALVAPTANGSVALNINGSFVYTPNLNFNGVDTFTYRASDGSNISSVVTVTITVTPVNDGPVAVNDAFTTPEDMMLTIAAPGVLANDSDVDGDALSAVIATLPTHGALTLNADGGFIYTPNLNFNGVDTFTYRATDGASNSNPATVTITVTPVNDAPVANNDVYTTAADTTLNIPAPGVLANDTDVENDVLNAVLTSNPASGTLSLNADGSFTYQPNTNFSGSDSFTYRATDGGATSGLATVTITVVPVPVVIANPPTSVTNCPGGTATFSIGATGTALTYQWLFNGAVMTGETNRSLTVLNTSATNAGAYCVLVNGAAGGPITNCAELVMLENVVVTMPPANLVVCEGTAAFFAVGATGTQLGYQWAYAGTTLTNETNATLILTNVALDAAGEYSVIVSGACGAPVTNAASLVVNQNVAILNAPASQTSFVGSNVIFSVNAVGTGLTYQWLFNGALVGTSNTLLLNNLTTNQAGVYCVLVSGVCGGPLTNCVTLTIQNRAPVATDDSYTTVEDQALTINTPGVLANDSDIDGDTLTAMLVSNPASGSLVFNVNGSFTFTPSLNFTGLVTFTYRVSDTQLTSAPATVTITVTPVNDAPVAVNDAYTTSEDTTLTIPATGVLANDSDVDGDVLSAVLVTGVAQGTLNLNGDGSFTYTPSLNFTGVVTFTYRASDTQLTSSPATVTINVTPLNDAPVAVNDAYTINEDTVLSIALPGILANDSDVDGDALNASLVTGAAHGTLSLNPSGSFLYTPNTNYHGLDSFTYYVSDGALTSGVATVTITINPTNDTPAAINDGYTTLEDTALTILPRGILTNDIDVDGDELTALLVNTTTHGTLSLSNNGAFYYTPSLNYTGTDTFTYRATDGVLTSDVATVTITVLPVNDTPVALNDAYTINEDTLLTVIAPGVLINDSDADGDTLSAALLGNPSNGSLVLNANGSFTYRPNTNFNGTDTFTYRSTDDSLTSGVATVTITILPVNDVPTVANDSYTTSEDTVLTINAPGVLANDSDLDNVTLESLLVSGVSHGTLSLSNNGAFRYTPSLNYTGVDTFTYRATDGALTSGVAMVTITVTPVNDAPVAADDFYTTLEDTALTIPAAGVLTNDYDVDGDLLTSLLVSNVMHGTLSLSNNGAFHYTPSLNYTGIDTFVYRATDGSLTSGWAVVTITVLPNNDAPVAVDDAFTTLEDTALTISAPGVLTNDSDVDGNSLTVSLVTSVQHGTLNLSGNGAFVYTPSLNYAGVDTFTYRATDGVLTSGMATVTITVTPVNDGPSVGEGETASVLEDGQLFYTSLGTPQIGVLANDIDADGDSLTAVLVTGVTHGTLVLNPNGSFLYTPTANYFGSDSFSYVAHDGLTSSAPATVSITVLPVNDAPSFSGAGDQRINQNAPAQSVNWASNLSAGPANESNQTLAFLVSNDNPALFSAQPAIAPNGTLTYSPAANIFGTANVSVRLQDNGGTDDGGVDTSSEVVFAIVVNSPPTVSIVSPANGSAFLFPATFSVISSASDPDGTVTNVQFLVNGSNFVSVAEAPFFFVMSNAAPGNYQFRAIATDNFGLTATSAVVNVDVITNFVSATGPILLNLQTGLFEQYVTISNRTSETWANGVRLFVQNLDTTNRVWNATGTNGGVPYLDRIVSVPAGGSTTLTVQYYVPNARTVPNPTLVAIPFPSSQAPIGSPMVAPHITRIHRVANGVEVHFTTQSARFYFLQSSEDLVHWTSSSVPIAGTGAEVVSPQSCVGNRFYRVLMVP
jgi:VCBS repeat-containing protein